jgi:antitoxin (DNA-binding transcriptional repressor) of toxin-antitoxin stability system
MATVRLNELPTDLQMALEQGEALDVTNQGAVVARIVPVGVDPVELDQELLQLVQERVVDLDHLPRERPLTEEERVKLEVDLAAFDEVAMQIGAAWRDDMSAADAVKEQRREL